MPVRSVLLILSTAELDEYQAFYEMEPWGFWSDHMHFGMLQALIYNVNRGKNTSAATASDFMPLDPRNKQRAIKKDEATITAFFMQAQALEKKAKAH